MQNRVLRLMFLVLVSVPVAYGQTSTSEIIEEIKATEPWTREPTAFRTVPFGATEAELSAVVGKVKCRDFKTWGEAGLPQRHCSVTERGKRLKIGESIMDETFVFHEGRLVAVLVNSDSAVWTAPSPPPSLSAVRDAFTERYGPPTLHQTIREKGVREVSIDRYVGGRRAGNRIDFVPYEYKRVLLSWDGPSIHATLGGNVDGDAFYAASLTTQQWRKLQDDTKAAAKKKASSADF